MANDLDGRLQDTGVEPGGQPGVQPGPVVTEPPAPDLPPARPGSLALGLLRTARPRQWAKNVLVFAAPAAAGVLDDPGPLADALVAFASFCVAASGLYLLNDAADVEADRRHPVKRNRPIAAGVVPVPLACAVGVLLVVAGIGLGFLTGSWELPAVTALYVTTMTAYNLGLKHVAVLDLGLIASGFVLRMVAGGVAVDVPISEWFLIVASFGSLFIVAGKRHAEHVELGTERGEHRPTLDEYSVAYLGYVRAVASGVMILAYCLWAFDRSEGVAGVPWYELSIIPFVLGVLRYALVVEEGRGGAPEDVVVRDRPIQLIGVVWAILTGLAIYLA